MALAAAHARAPGPLPHAAAASSRRSVAGSCGVDDVRPSGRQAAPCSLLPSRAARRLGAGFAADLAPRRLVLTRAADGENEREAVGDVQRRRMRRGRYRLRDPDDSPLRNSNRDRLMGLLTDRAAKSLAYYLTETNMILYRWWIEYLQKHPIPTEGDGDMVSGDEFLRTLLHGATETITTPTHGEAAHLAVDPRSMAQRVMAIREQLAKEAVADLHTDLVKEASFDLLRESLDAQLGLGSTGGPGGGDADATGPAAGPD